MQTENSGYENIDFSNLSEDAATLVRILGSTTIDGDFVFTPDIVDKLVVEKKLVEEKEAIYEKLRFLGVLPREEKNDNS
jgi:hypothetical protein